MIWKLTKDSYRRSPREGEEILQYMYYKHVWFLNLLDLKYLYSVQSVHHCLVEIGK